MTYGLHTSGLGAIIQGVKLDIIANNLANINTAGFKKDTVVFMERLPEAIENPGAKNMKYFNLLIHRYGGAPFIHTVSYNQTPGPLEDTNRPLDISIVGDGFFGVKDPATGRVLYTRAGNIVTNPQGYLVTPDGRYYYVGPDGEPIVVTNPALVRIDNQGFVFEGAEQIGQIGVFDFAQPDKLYKAGDTVFAGEEALPRPATDYHINTGKLEKSNTDPTKELVDLIQTIRALEANLMMIRFQDATLDRIANDVPRPR